MGYTPTDVEQWVRQQNASQQKQAQIAASSIYTREVHKSCDHFLDSGHYGYWPDRYEHVPSVHMARGPLLSSVGYVEQPRYGNIDANMDLHHHYHENYRVPSDSLTLEQRQQRQDKMGRLQVIRQMLTNERQIPVTSEPVYRVMDSRFLQSQAASGVCWNSVPCGDSMYPRACNSTSNMMKSQYDCYSPDWDVSTASRRKWYHMQHMNCVNKAGMPGSYYHCSSNARFAGRRAAYAASPAEPYQLPHRSRMKPTLASCDWMHAYPPHDPQTCNYDGGMLLHHKEPSVMYGYTDIGMQQNCASEFANGNSVVPAGVSRQFAYCSMPYEQQGSVQKWKSGEDVKQGLMTSPAFQQGQQSILTPQQNSYSTGGSTVSELASCIPVSCSVAQPSTAAVRQRQSSSSKKMKIDSSVKARLAEVRSKTLDSAISVTRSGGLMNITSSSLAHLAQGVENISAIMQQNVKQGGLFQSVRGSDDHAVCSDENANFIPADCSQQVQAAPGGLSSVDEKTPSASACISVASTITSPCTSGSFSTGSLTAFTTCSRMLGVVSTTGVDIIVTSKAPYTISYRPTGEFSEINSHGSVDVRSISSSSFGHSARMLPQTCVAHRLSATKTVSSDRTAEDFSRHNNNEQSATLCRKNPAGAVLTGTHLSMANSVAVIQPQMMSGTQLFIADHYQYSHVPPALNSFVLPADVPSSTYRSPQPCQSLQHYPNSESSTVQWCVPVSVSEPNIPVLYSPNAQKPSADLVACSK